VPERQIKVGHTNNSVFEIMIDIVLANAVSDIHCACPPRQSVLWVFSIRIHVLSGKN
jgi:hypothetical protein